LKWFWVVSRTRFIVSGSVKCCCDLESPERTSSNQAQSLNQNQNYCGVVHTDRLLVCDLSRDWSVLLGLRTEPRLCRFEVVLLDCSNPDLDLLSEGMNLSSDVQL